MASKLEKKIENLGHISHLLDIRIVKQEEYLSKVVRGVVNYAAIDRNVLYALANGELNLLKFEKEKVEKQIKDAHAEERKLRALEKTASENTEKNGSLIGTEDFINQLTVSRVKDKSSI